VGSKSSGVKPNTREPRAAVEIVTTATVAWYAAARWRIDA
jgi:hypothetical protein